MGPRPGKGKMRRFILRVVAASAAVWALTGLTYAADPLRLSIGQAYGAKQPCMGVVTEHLKQLNVDQEDVERISVMPEKPPKGPVLGNRAWVSLKSCKGSLIIFLTTKCKVVDTYTRGECRIGGVKEMY